MIIPDTSWHGQGLKVGNKDGGQCHQNRRCYPDHRLEHLAAAPVVGQLIDQGEDHCGQHGVEKDRRQLGIFIYKSLSNKSPIRLLYKKNSHW